MQTFHSQTIPVFLKSLDLVLIYQISQTWVNFHRILEGKNECVEMVLLEMNWGPSRAPHPTSTLGSQLVM